MRKAFTLIELVVAIGILAMVLSFAGVIFQVSIDSRRLALANAEIMRKLRVITDQLDADFHQLRKDGEIFVIWHAERKRDFVPPQQNHPSAFERFDRIMFFADGDFETYRDSPPWRGNTARIGYSLAHRLDPTTTGIVPHVLQEPRDRILTRTQHILLAPEDARDRLEPADFNDYDADQWRQWNSQAEYDHISIGGWARIPLPVKAHMLSVIGDVTVGYPASSNKNTIAGGVRLDPNDPGSLHVVLCEGVGQFKVQGWSDGQRRWIPQVNPDGDPSLDDSDFILDGGDLHRTNKPGVWYAYPNGGVVLNGIAYPNQQVDRAHFNEIPGLGPALKFTFTLYDSQGLIKGGKTFTHIVYLDK